MTLHRRQLPGFFPHPHAHLHSTGHTHTGKTAPIKAGEGGNGGSSKKAHAVKNSATRGQHLPSHPAQAQHTSQRAIVGQPQHLSAPPQAQPTQQAPQPSGIPSGAVVITKYETKSQTFSGKPAGYFTGDSTSSAVHSQSTHALGVPIHHSGSTSKMATVASITAFSSVHFTSPTDYPASSPSPSASSSSSSSGMSTGAKIGIAVGVIGALALLIGLIVFAVRRRRSDDDDDRKKLADEKAPFGGPVPAFAGGVIGNGSSSGAMNEKPLGSPSSFNGPAAAGAASRGIPPVASNTYEMASRENVPSRDGANDPSNPFGNHAEMVAASAAASGAAVAAAASPRKPVPGAASLSPKPLSVKSAHSGRSSPEHAARNPPSRTGSPAVNGAAMAGRPGPGPRGPPPGPDNVHRVQLDFKPSMEDELELRAGQVVRLLHEYDDGWALCVRLDRSQQGVVPRTCLSKHPVRPRPPPGMRPGQGPPRAGSPAMSNYSGRSSPAMMDGARRPGPAPGMNRPRANSNTPYIGGPPRSMSPGPRAAEPQYDQRRRSNSTSNIMSSRRMSPPNGPINPSPFNPQASLGPSRKPVAGQAL